MRKSDRWSHEQAVLRPLVPAPNRVARAAPGGNAYVFFMLGVLLAAFITGPKPVAKPHVAMVKAASVDVVRKAEKVESATPLDRLLQGWSVAAALPVVIKPEFNNGPAAAFSVKF